MPEHIQPKATMVIQNSAQIVLPTGNPKTVAVLQIDKQQVADHSYAFGCHLNRGDSDDSAYMSRSCMESDCDTLYSPTSTGHLDVDTNISSADESGDERPLSCMTPLSAGGASGSAGMLSPGTAHLTDDEINSATSPGAAACEIVESSDNVTVETTDMKHVKPENIETDIVDFNAPLDNQSEECESVQAETKPEQAPASDERVLCKVPTGNLKSLKGHIVTLAVDNKLQRYIVTQAGPPKKNKYIIEDDLPPVAKFAATNTEKKQPVSTTTEPAVHPTRETAALTAVSELHPNFVTSDCVATNLYDVLPLSDAKDKPVQFMSVSSESSGEDSPAVILPPPLVVPDEDNSRSCTPLPPTEMSPAISSLPSDDPNKINLRIQSRNTQAAGGVGTAAGTPYKNSLNASIGSSIGALSLDSLNRLTNTNTATIVSTTGKIATRHSNVTARRVALSKQIPSLACHIDCEPSTHASNKTAKHTASHQYSNYYSQNAVAGDGYHPLVEHDYCFFKHFSAHVQSNIIAMTDGGIKTDKKYSKRIKNAFQKDPLRSLEKGYAFKPGRGRPKKKVDPVLLTTKEQIRDSKRALVKKHAEQTLRRATLKANLRRVSSPMRRSKRDDKNFVKITGSFQDDFVYYTTKNKRGRPRKSIPTNTSSKDFIPMPMPKQNAVAGAVNEFAWYKDLANIDKSSRFGIPEPSVTPPVDTTDESSMSTTSTEVYSPPPVAHVNEHLKDSDITDLVCELSEAASSVQAPEVDLDSMAKEVRNMLNNMDETTIHSVLENQLLSSHGSSTGHLGDLEDINDQDLIMMPGNSSASAVNPLSNAVHTEPKLVPSSNAVPSQDVVNQTAPELTVVSMFWNDLPGLIISGRKYVRLVDIHKQMLPAKDTGILKKRCQMLDLNVCNCSDMQRDFLIRYANAAKSKSTVIVDKDSAVTLISFYVEPRPKASTSTTMKPPTYQEHFLDRSASSHKAREVMMDASGACDSLASTAQPGREQAGLVSTSRRTRLVATEDSDRKRSSRLKHKAGKYVEMLQGNVTWNETDGTSVTRHSPTRRPAMQDADSGVDDNDNFTAHTTRRMVDHTNKLRIRKLKNRLKSSKVTHQLLQQQQQHHLKTGASGGEVAAVVPEVASVGGAVSSEAQDVTDEHVIVDDIEQSADAYPAADTVVALSVLDIVHRDNCSRSSQRGRVQQGHLHMDQYKTRDAPCVECVMCKEQFSVKKFMKHQHPPCRPDELVDVSLPQKLELCNIEPTAAELELWNAFEAKQKEFGAQSADVKSARSVSHRRSASSGSAKVDANHNDSGIVCETAAGSPHRTTIAKGKHGKPAKVAVPPISPAAKPAARTADAARPPSTTKVAGIPVVDDGNVRHSTRVRKRKQMDEFVYSPTGANPTTTPSPTPVHKRPRLSPELITKYPVTTSADRAARSLRRSRGSGVGRVAEQS